MKKFDELKMPVPLIMANSILDYFRLCHASVDEQRITVEILKQLLLIAQRKKSVTELAISGDLPSHSLHMHGRVLEAETADKNQSPDNAHTV